MSFLDALFSNSSHKDTPQSRVPWRGLTSIKQLEELAKESEKNAVVIFKHSTRCGISRSVLKLFESEFNDASNATFYLLDLLNFREISDEVATRFGIRHESPQVLLIKNGACVYNASHGDIEFSTIGNLY